MIARVWTGRTRAEHAEAYAPEDERYLLALDPEVQHYEVPALALDVDALRERS